MGKFVIKGPKQLTGDVMISGSKNSAVAIIPAALLVSGSCVVENVPLIGDVNALVEILGLLGVSVNYLDKYTIRINGENLNTHIATYEMVKHLRASYYLLGALLGRFKKAQVPLPGGCDFGYRPIDQHIKGFEALGAKITIEHGIIKAEAHELIGASIYLDIVSVGATINLMLAAVKAQGTTTIENAAKEPHVVDVANFLNAMGANVRGAGTDVIKIRGVDEIKGEGVHNIIPDQIEAGTFMILGAAKGNSINVKNIIPKHMESLSAKLLEIGALVEENGDSIRVTGSDNILKANIKTLPYPGFPTDLHPQFAALLCLAEGTSAITESIWDSRRFHYVEELKKMGASIRVEGRMALIEGVKMLTGAPTKAIDLRAGAALVIAALVGKGTSEVSNIGFIDRGYEELEVKLAKLGADIRRFKDD